VLLLSATARAELEVAEGVRFFPEVHLSPTYSAAVVVGWSLRVSTRGVEERFVVTGVILGPSGLRV
jgi:hypothetical protein